jgi:hypothetical protein
MGEETEGLDPGFLKLGKIQGLDPRLLTSVNSTSGNISRKDFTNFRIFMVSFVQYS